MTQMIKPQLCIIGGGAGGLSLAAGATQLGVDVVLVESDKMGGDCLNQGCIPSKTLLACGKYFLDLKNAYSFGLIGSVPDPNFSAAMKRVQEVIDTVAHHDSIERFTELGVKVIQGSGAFVDPNTLQAGEYRIQAKTFVIATGSKPKLPPIPGLAECSYLTTDNVFSLQHAPKSLIVLGGGPIGCELAQAFSNLGVPVSLVEHSCILQNDESDCVDILRDSLKGATLDLYENCHELSIRQAEEGIEVSFIHQEKPQTIRASHLLLATGRQPQLEELQLERAKVQYNAKGIETNVKLQTTNKRIYAIGDVIGTFQFTHVANYHAGLLIKHLFFKMPISLDYRTLPWVTYTKPELAHVGLRIQDATKQGISFVVTELPLRKNDRAQTEGSIRGKIKILTKPNGQVLGVTILGENAGELLFPWILAIRDKKKLSWLAQTLIPYPTYSEITKQVSGQFYAPKLFSRLTRAFVKFLSWF